MSSLQGMSSLSTPPVVMVATPSYSLVSDKLRRLSTGSLQCSLFCGGTRCKYECQGKWPDKDKAIQGLFSHWVTPVILAMARPSSHLFQKHGLLDQFKSCGIGTVINLQLPWEHSKCGPGIKSSGFTYNPEELMNHGVYFYNYGWMDYGVPTLESVLDMVKVVDFALCSGKVAIHCHAGLGRTGVLIACYLIYSMRIDGDEAIGLVREKRPGSIQTRPQIEIVQQFSHFLNSHWSFYPTPSHAALTFDEYLYNQSLLLHGNEQENLKYVPKVVMDVCARILQYQSCDMEQNEPMRSQHDDDIISDDRFQLSSDLQCRLEAIQSEMNNSLEWKLLATEHNINILLSLLFSYFRQLKVPFLGASEVAALKDDCNLDVLSLSKKFTLVKCLDTLKCLSFNKDHLASFIARILVHSSWSSSDSTGAKETLHCVEKLVSEYIHHHQ